MPADPQPLINAIPDAIDGQVISSAHHNSIRPVLQSLLDQLKTINGGTGTPTIAQPTGPSVVKLSDDRIDVFAPGTDLQLLHRWRTGTQWTAWEALGGTFAGSPAAVSWGPNHIDVFVRG